LSGSRKSLKKPEEWEIERLKRKLDYQYYTGIGDLLLEPEIRVLRSSRTGRIREIYLNGKLLAVVRLKDGHLLISIEGAKKIVRKLPPPHLRVVVSEEAAPFISKGRSVYAKHVIKVDTRLRPGNEVIIVDEKDNVLAVGRLFLSPREITEFRRGVAVRTRKTIR